MESENLLGRGWNLLDTTTAVKFLVLGAKEERFESREGKIGLHACIRVVVGDVVAKTYFEKRSDTKKHKTK